MNHGTSKKIILLFLSLMFISTVCSETCRLIRDCCARCLRNKTTVHTINHEPNQEVRQERNQYALREPAASTPATIHRPPPPETIIRPLPRQQRTLTPSASAAPSRTPITVGASHASGKPEISHSAQSVDISLASRKIRSIRKYNSSAQKDPESDSKEKTKNDSPPHISPSLKPTSPETTITRTQSLLVSLALQDIK